MSGGALVRLLSYEPIALTSTHPIRARVRRVAPLERSRRTGGACRTRDEARIRTERVRAAAAAGRKTERGDLIRARDGRGSRGCACSAALPRAIACDAADGDRHSARDVPRTTPRRHWSPVGKEALVRACVRAAAVPDVHIASRHGPIWRAPKSPLRRRQRREKGIRMALISRSSTLTSGKLQARCVPSSVQLSFSGKLRGGGGSFARDHQIKGKAGGTP